MTHTGPRTWSPLSLGAALTMACASPNASSETPVAKVDPAGDEASSGTAAPPKLVLQITVDQLRGELPRRYYDRLSPDGFRYLMDHGTVYLDAHHRHAVTETVVGHTTLATGADPASHGMVGNVWLDRNTGEMTYNVEDARYPLLSEGAGIDASTEIDPTQKMARSDGRSPSAILSSTFSDELTLYTGARSKVFGVSVKDRAAIAMAGHTGKAFWFSKQSAQFVTSRFYYDAYPEWVRSWNAGAPASAYAGESWSLLHDPSTYLFGDRDDRPYETELGGYGRIFPHPYGSDTDKYFTTLLTISPAGDELTLDFAKTLIESEGLGEDAVPDYLSISFSSTDYVGHLFGPSSLESEDNILRLDQTLAELFAFVDEKVGLENTLIVLSADHGGIEAPGYLSELGFDASYVDLDTFDSSPAIDALERRFGAGKELIAAYSHPYIYLDRALIREKKLDYAEVEAAVAEEVERLEHVAVAIGGTRLRAGAVPDTWLFDAILRSHHPGRSGDIYVQFEPNYFINDFDGLIVATTHGSPYNYDSYVPLMFAGAGIPAQQIVRSVETVDVAPTLSILIGAKPPNATSGAVLHELF